MFAIKLDPTHRLGTNAVQHPQSKTPVIDSALETLQTQDSPYQPAYFHFRAKTIEVDLRLLIIYSKTFNTNWVYIQPDGIINADLDIEQTHISLLMQFLRGIEIDISPQNIQGLIEAATYFDTPILIEQLLANAHKFAECLEAASQEQVVDYSRLLNLMIGYEYSRESQLEFIAKLKITHELRKQLIEFVPSYQDANLQVLLNIQKDLAVGKPLNKIPSFKKLSDAIPEMSCKEFKELLAYAERCDSFKEPLLKKIAEGLLLKNNVRIEKFFENFMVAIPDTKIDPIIDHLSKLYHELTKLQKQITYVFFITDHLNLKIQQQAQLLNDKMNDLQKIIDQFQENNPTKAQELVKIIKILQKAGMKIITNLDKALEIRKGKARTEKILNVVFLSLGIAVVALFIALAFWYLFCKVPSKTHIVQYCVNETHLHTYKTMAFRTIDNVIVPVLFSGMLWGPILTAVTWASLRQYLRTNEKLRKRHVLRGVHREM